MENFLEKLESQLTILTESEQKKIIKRYQREIEEKMNDGMAEEEAVKSLGNLDSIVSDIYKEYHLDRKQLKEKKKVGGWLNKGIRNCSIFLADTCTDISYHLNHMSNSALEAFFEVLLKITLLIIVIIFLKLPFLLIQNFYQFGLNFLFYPFDRILIRLFDFVLTVIYLMVCISFAIVLFKENKEKTEKIAEENGEDKSLKKQKVKSSETARNYAYAILKVCLYIIFLIPMIFITLILLLLTILALFFVCKGVSIIGLVVILVGLLFLSIVVTAYITDALDNRSRNHTLALIVTVISLISGSILFVDNLMNFHYPKKLEKSSFIPFTESLVIELENESFFANLNGDIKFIVDDSIKENQVLIEITYFDELYDVRIDQKDDFIMAYTIRDDFEMADVHYLYQNIFKDLKNNNIYDYQNLSNLEIVIYGNEDTKELLKF